MTPEAAFFWLMVRDTHAVSDAEDARSGFERSTAEAISSFGDGRMLVEKYIEDGHHIEIQARKAFLQRAMMHTMRARRNTHDVSPMLLITLFITAGMFGLCTLSACDFGHSFVAGRVKTETLGRG